MQTSIGIAAASASLLIALLHIFVIIRGAPAYRAFGAGESLAAMAESGSWVPALLTSLITAVFVVFAVYFLSGAGILPHLPLLKYVMIGIAAIYLLRGSLVLLALNGKMAPFDFYSSLVSLLIGALHAAAVWAAWPVVSVG